MFYPHFVHKYVPIKIELNINKRINKKKESLSAWLSFKNVG